MRRQSKFAAGVLVAFGVGLGASLAGIAVPAPPALFGALLVVAMTAGYLGADRFVRRYQAACRDMCAGPDGLPHSDAGKTGVRR